MDTQRDFTLEKLKGDASNRSYFRMIFRDENIFPKTLVLMKLNGPFDREKDDFLQIRDFMEDCNVPVPAFYFANPEKGYIYLEDCGDLSLAETVTGGGSEEKIKHYPRVIDILVTLQVEGTRKMDKKNPAAKRKFNTEKYMEELQHTAKWFIKGHCKKELSENDAERLEKAFYKLVSPIEKEPLVFTHRDYHSRNIMVKKGRYLILDFQDARLGPMQYDLASLLFDPYVKLEDGHRSDLLAYYLGRLKFEAKSPDSKNSFLEMFYRVSLQRNLKALGTFAFQSVSRENDFYLKYVSNTVDYISVNIYKIRELEKDADWIVSLITHE